MSLINDALKRAKDASAPAAAGPAPQLKPAEHRRSPVGLPAYFVPAMLMVLAGACWFLVQGWDRRRQQGELAPQPITVHAREIVAPPTLSSAEHDTAGNEFKEPPLAEETYRPIPANRIFSLHANRPAAAAPEDDAATSTSTAATPERAAAKTFKLQGIFYRPQRASALINSKSVSVGDSVAGAKVKSIQRDSVTLEHDGKTEVLTWQ